MFAVRLTTLLLLAGNGVMSLAGAIVGPRAGFKSQCKLGRRQIHDRDALGVRKRYRAGAHNHPRKWVWKQSWVKKDTLTREYRAINIIYPLNCILFNLDLV